MDLSCFVSGCRPDPGAPAAKAFSDLRSGVRASASGPASDLRKFSPSGMRQRQWLTSTCVAQSTVRAVEIKRVVKAYESALASGLTEEESLARALAQHKDLSRMMVYFLAREMMSPPETDKDEGTYVSFAAEALARHGVCLESEWPWDERLIFSPPSWSAMRSAFIHKIKEWRLTDSMGQDRVDDCILSLSVRNPVVYSTVVGSRWESYDGSEPLGLVDGVVKGRHATVLVGWDPVRGVFIGENSWGSGWGLDGFYEVRPEVVASPDSSDFVTYYGGWETYLEAL